MATVDSGNETLFSDESPCELAGSPSNGCDSESRIPEPDPSSRLAPPNIQPYSGVLEKGKVLIRPIAFKPIGMTPAARFGVAGERYGSTPILPRPNSHLTLYGSTTDIRHHHLSTNSNYSLDRKLRSSCLSTNSSPPLDMASLSSLPHKLTNYDSLESVRKSPMSMADCNLNKSSYRMSAECDGSLLDLTPSPSDSGVSELEAALRDRDSELAYLRQTMEHNEQVIFRVYQEKERVWERELRRLKTVHESRLRASAQKALKLEQMLMMQSYQLQQDKKRLCAEAHRAACQSDQYRQEVETLRARLEEMEWALCQKTGEIALLKSQLKDSQNEQTTKGHELLQMRTELRDITNTLEDREIDVEKLSKEVSERDREIEMMKKEMNELKVEMKATRDTAEEEISEAELLRAEIRELREELSDVSMSSEYEGVQAGRTTRVYKDIVFGAVAMEDRSQDSAKDEVERLESEMRTLRKAFEQERVTWAQEKEKVLKYQRQLQLNYVQMFRKTRSLEAEVESLSLELELESKSGFTTNSLPPIEMAQTIEL